MANAEIIIADQPLLPQFVLLYNEVFRPPVDIEYFRRRFRSRYNVCMMLAQVEQRPIGFVMGYELKPGTFYLWLYGTLTEFRRQGIAQQLVEAMKSWTAERHYDSMRIDVRTSSKAAMHFAVEQDFRVVGLRWDTNYHDHMLLMEFPIEH